MKLPWGKMAFRGLVLALLAVSASDSWGQSKQPPKNTPAAQQVAPADQRGTEQQPLTVKVLPAEKTQADTDDEKQHRDNEIGLTKATWILAIFTAFLVLVALGQLVLFWIQLKLIGDSLVDAKKAADAAEKAADAAKANAQAVVNSERARIFVIIDQDTTNSIRGAATVELPHLQAATVGANVGLFYGLKNYGKTPAIIKEISHHMVCAAELTKTREKVPAAPLPIDHILTGDQRTNLQTLVCSLDHKINIATAKDIQASESIIWFYGYVSYDDTFGWGRELRYIFYYNGSTGGRFRLWSYQEHKSPQPHEA